jgi:release factor glutamine methyltransferase
MRYNEPLTTTPTSGPTHADATARLRAAGCVFAEDEATMLIAAAADAAQLDGLIARRAAGEPLEQVVGYADFCGVRVRLRPGVFVPRVRSELLVRLAADAADAAGAAAAGASGPVVVDMCCGSGALGAAVALRVPGIELHAADLEPAAVACAHDNLAALGAQVYCGDLFAALPVGLRGRIDVLLANVPYVRTAHIPMLPVEARLHEPMLSLDGGADGLDVYRAVVAAAADWLAPGGVLLSEATDAQTTAASAALAAAGLRAELVHDEDLEATAVLGHRSPNAAPRAVSEVDPLR